MKRIISMPGISLLVLLIVPGCALAQVTPHTPQNSQPGQLPPVASTPQPVTGQSAPQAPQQSKAAQQPQGGKHGIVVRSDLVLVPVTVKDRSGQLVGDLQRADFRVFCDGVDQQISSFSSEAFPLSAVVLIDNDLTQKQATQVQKSLTAIAAGFGPADEAAVVTYDEFPNTVSDFSFNNDLLYTQLKRLDLGSHFPENAGGPMTAGPMINGQSQATGVPSIGARSDPVTKDMDDAIYAAAEMLKGRGRDRRKIIFLITDGNNARNNTHSFKETMQLLLTNDVSVYSISVGHALFQHQTGRLERYAQGTGGDTFYAGNDRDLGRLYPEVTEQARNQYTITFSPQDIHRGEDYHPIEVRVRRPDLNVSARQGYYQSGIVAPH